MVLLKQKKKLFLGSNLSYLLNNHSIDIKNLSIETGVPAPTLTRLKKSGSNPTLSSIEPLLEFFRVDIETLLYQDMTHPSYPSLRKMGDLIPISVFSLKEFEVGATNAKVSKFIGEAGITGKNVFGISINSSILAPAFQSNSTVIIDPDINPVESDYVLCILEVEKSTKPVFRQLFIDGNDYYFKPINPMFGDMKRYSDYKILGVIIKSIETFR